MYSVLLLQQKRPKCAREEKHLQWAGIRYFRERECNFSLCLREIRSSAVFGARRKAALREKGFAWVPDLGSFFKLLEVGVSPYLVLFPLLSTL